MSENLDNNKSNEKKEEDKNKNTILLIIPDKLKLKKKMVFYTSPTVIPPLAWIYECRRCAFYLKNKQKCMIISEKGEPDDGFIAKNAWCLLFFGKNAPLKWLSEKNELQNLLKTYFNIDLT